MCNNQRRIYTQSIDSEIFMHGMLLQYSTVENKCIASINAFDDMVVRILATNIISIQEVVPLVQNMTG